MFVWGIFAGRCAIFNVKRAQIIDKLPTGAMLAVPMREEELVPLLGKGLSLGAVNGPSLCVVSGEKTEIEKLEQKLRGKEIMSRYLPVTHAFHSVMMEEAKEKLMDIFSSVKYGEPRIPYISNLTGKEITKKEVMEPSYWYHHTCETVRFSEGIKELLTKDIIFLEVGPGRNLVSAVLQHQTKDINLKGKALNTIRNITQKSHDYEHLLSTLGKLWLQGVKMNWEELYNYAPHYRVDLPTYSFEKKRYWIEPDVVMEEQQRMKRDGVIRFPLAEWFYKPCWIRKSSTVTAPILKDQQYLVFVNNDKLQEKIVKLLGKIGVVYIVKPGDRYSVDKSGKIYTVVPDGKSDYSKLFKALKNNKVKLNQIIHLWLLDKSATTHTATIDSVNYYQRIGFYSLLYCVQESAIHNVFDSLILSVITSDVYEVTGDEELYPEKATIQGLVKCIPYEYPEIKCRSIDVAQENFDNVVDEILCAPEDKTDVFSDNQLVAYRNSILDT